MRKVIIGASLLLSFVAAAAGWPEAKDPEPYNPKIAPASDEGVRALKRIRVPKGMTIDLFAAEPMLANPVAFCIDERGRFYVAESFRINDGVTDNRGHTYWLDDELACRTVADRVAMYRKHLKDKFPEWEREHERVRRLVDVDGDGKADKSTVFAHGFHKAEDGLGAGLLARKGDVYFTCIPHLWCLRDNDNDGKADVKKSLSEGYGVHVAFIGHDLHGLVMGPDGRLYFSVGDRGLNVKTKEGKHLFYPDTGSVLRCDPDGSNLEVFATGLRNPQELAFDDYGNLFTVDNNSDGGDRARLVHVVEGGDSGWRIGYQYGSQMHDDRSRRANRGPWHFEKLWHTRHEGQPAYVLPPLAHFADGPSGLVHYPGVGLADKYKGHFFLCDFRGNPATSGVRAFTVKPKGASFELADHEQFVWSILATDCDFGPDGAFYISDWVQGWGKTGKGRLYKVSDPEAIKAPAVAEARKLLAEGFDKRPVEELAKLLGHPHRQVRLEAQYALAERASRGRKPPEVIDALAKVAKGKGGATPPLLARLHAIWCLGQIGRENKAAGRVVSDFLFDKDAQVRAQAVKTFGDCPPVWKRYFQLVPLLADPEPRVRFHTAMTLSRVDRAAVADDEERRTVVYEAVRKALRRMLKENADGDPYLRHAGALALANFLPEELIRANDAGAAERMAAVLALRHVRSPKVAHFLADVEPTIIAEAARAIHDKKITKALPKLAALIDNVRLPAAVLYRVLNANFRLGKAKNAIAVAKFAAAEEAPPALRVEALRMLGAWAKPGRRDRVTGLTQDLGERPVRLAVDAVKAVLGGLFSAPDRVRREATKVTANLGIKEVGPTLLAMVGDKDRGGEVRAEALRGLEALKDERLEQAVKLALSSDEPRLRGAARRVLAKLRPDEGIKELAGALRAGTVIEKQAALDVLGGLTDSGRAQTLIGEQLDALLAKKLPAALHLEALEAARKSKSEANKEKLSRYEASLPKDNPTAAYRAALRGGDAERGRRVFFHKTEASCLRCHKVNGEGGEVGPDLTGIGSKQGRDYLLEALVDPNKQIAKGFETVVLTTTRGLTHVGIVKAEDADTVRLITAEAKIIEVPRKEIDERLAGKSAMPEDLLKHLSRSEVRDLVEFLAGLKETPGK